MDSTEEEAEECVASYEEFDDASFEAMITVAKKTKISMKKNEEEEKAMKHGDKEEKPKAEEVTTEESEAEEVEAEEAAAEEATEELFDGVESTEATLVDASDETDEIEATRASVAEWLENNVLSK